ncbi:preprotein translocase subunit SecE [Candidatus Uhrbacteria bacterium CG_4_9_14_3_um_filter_50_9]|uniref:Protein translocase subunit SecE n=1 Tax=Candidatus Uhrbacteria bacterium CG_4_9_14_3_um_filter_50_9 TaxID=1975035 RepID=A0A2M7XCS9_9BACT|nr:MAG: preprotein translocase subunit SecE [Candidatus Uhrbacteria bacterium CG_4_9_14_3_um_filter_50_9]
MQPLTQKKENPIQWLFRYLKESREELKKVTWPSKQVTTKYSLIVVVLSIVIAGFFGGLDWVLNLGLERLIDLTA